MPEVATFHDYWPLVVIEAPVHSSVEAMEFFCARHDELFKRRERFATINDMRRMRGTVDPKARKSVGDWTKAREIEIGRWLVATANVVDNPLIRGVITAVHWFVKPPSPLLVTGHMREGVDFCVGHLRREKIPLSAKLHDALGQPYLGA